MFKDTKFIKGKEYMPINDALLIDKNDRESDDESDGTITTSFCEIDGNPVQVFNKGIISCNIIEVEAGTNGYHGGDSSSGCRTFISIKDIASTDIRINHLTENNGDKGFQIILGGDTELYTFIKAFEFIVNVLKTQTDGKKPACYDEDENTLPSPISAN